MEPVIWLSGCGGLSENGPMCLGRIRNVALSEKVSQSGGGGRGTDFNPSEVL